MSFVLRFPPNPGPFETLVPNATRRDLEKLEVLRKHSV